MGSGGSVKEEEKKYEDSDDEEEINMNLKIQDDCNNNIGQSKDDEARREIESREKSKGERLRERLRNSHPGHVNDDETNKAIENACQRAATRRSQAIDNARKELNAINLDTTAFEKAALAPLRNELKAIECEEEKDALDLQTYKYSYNYDEQQY